MKIRMTNTYSITEIYDTIEIDPNDYDELKGLSEQEVIDYLNENAYDFRLKDSEQECIADDFRFEKDIVKEKTYDEEQTFFIAK